MKKYITLIGNKPTTDEGRAFTCEVELYDSVGRQLPDRPRASADAKQARKLADSLDQLLASNKLASALGLSTSNSPKANEGKEHCCAVCRAGLEKQLRNQIAAAGKLARFLHESGGYRADEGKYVTLIGHHPLSETGSIFTIEKAAFDELDDYLAQLKTGDFADGTSSRARRVRVRLARNLRSGALAQYLQTGGVEPCWDCDGGGCASCNGTGDKPFTLTVADAERLLQFLISSRGYHLAARWHRPSNYRKPRLSKAANRRLAA